VKSVVNSSAGFRFKPIVIVGGGLSGLTLGIALRNRGVPVKIFEAGRYPRHRVCGEFICGRGQETLRRIGLPLMENGAREACSAAVFAEGMPVVGMKIKTPALCISRFVLDDLLAREFLRLGGELHEQNRFQDDAGGAEGIVHASGRRLHPVVQGWRWVGLKVHARGVEMRADLEVHVTSAGYIGLCRLGNEVNICGLFRSETTLPGLAHRWKEMLGGDPGSTLEKSLASAEFDDDSFCSVAGLSVGPSRIKRGGRCELGDALTMIPPVTGNGMSMAFESAELAALPVFLYSRGDMAWNAAVERVAADCERRFRTRLMCAGLLHKMMFNSRWAASLRWMLPRFPGLPELLFRWTR